MSLTTPRTAYKPHHYPWAFEAWQKQQQMHWLPDEVPLADDVRDWNRNLTPSEKHLLTNIFRFFTQSDVEVNGAYVKHYLPRFKATEVQMMLQAFTNAETIHIAAYSHLLDTVGMPEVEYTAFLDYAEMRDKHDFMQGFTSNNDHDLAVTMATFGAFIEGLALFASFAVLLNFPRFNKMKGMGQIIAWSVRDETLHCQSIIKLWKTFCQEAVIEPTLVQKEITQNLVQVIRHEDKFIDLAFEQGGVQGLTPDEVKAYIRYIGNMRLRQLGFPTLYSGVDKNPLPWLDEMLNGVEFANFFETRATDYARAATRGDWQTDVWTPLDLRAVSFSTSHGA